MSVYELRGVTKHYPRQPRPANKDIDLVIGAGEIFGLLGDNGAGKSTLLHQMIGLIPSTSGSIKLLGREVHRHPRFVSLHLGYMPQAQLGLGNLTVDEAVYFTARLRGMRSPAARDERDSLVAAWGLDGQRGTICRRLSGGQRRLLQLAVTLAGAPPVIVLDEPTNELSPQRCRQVWQMLRETNQRRGTTVVFVTHDAIEAEKVIQRVGIMSAGELIAVGPPHQLKQQLTHRMRLEICFDPRRPPGLALPAPPVELAPGRWLIHLDVPEVDPLLRQLELCDLDDFRLQSATLEDLYQHYVSRTARSVSRTARSQPTAATH